MRDIIKANYIKIKHTVNRKDGIKFHSETTDGYRTITRLLDEENE